MERVSVSFFSRENTSGPFEFVCEEHEGEFFFAETRGPAEEGRNVEEVFPSERFSMTVEE